MKVKCRKKTIRGEKKRAKYMQIKILFYPAKKTIAEEKIYI